MLATLTFDASTLTCDASTLTCDTSTWTFDALTLICDALTLKCDALTLIFDALTFDASTLIFDTSTLIFDTSILTFDDSTLKCDSSTLIFDVYGSIFQADSYEEVYTASGSSQDPSDSEAEVGTEVILTPRGLHHESKNSIPPVATRGSISTEGSIIREYSREGNQFQGVGKASSIDRRSQTPHLIVPRTPIILSQRSKTPGPYDLGRESLASRYMIEKGPEREVKSRQRLSKTPDRELGAQRRYSLTSVKRLSKSCESLDSTGNGGNNFGKRAGTEGRKSKLKEHRKKGKRAATVHTLDTDQLLLILNLQMRYLQESKEQEQNRLGFEGSARRAITPQPVSQKKIIPQKIRSHTPQPRRANGQIRDSREQSLYAQNITGNVFQRQRLRSDGGSCVSNSGNSSRRTSESSDKTFDFMTNVPNRVNGEFVYYQGLESKLGADRYPHSQQTCQNSQAIKDSHNPYIHTQVQKSSPDNLHYVTYSDSMLNTPSRGPKSRGSSQNHTLPPQPLHRSAHQQLPPQPITRQKNIDRQLPPKPVHRGTSAFHVVDRAPKSRSPSGRAPKSRSSADREVQSRSPSVNESTASSERKLQSDFADVAIRENFSLNPKENGGAVLENGERNPNVNPNGNFILRGYEAEPSETLPPYSGPPSYKEYVSSCNTSVTSSLSSNPDDVYGMPRRRVRQESLIRENGVSKAGPSNPNTQSQNVAGNLYKLTSASNSGIVTRREFNHLEQNGISSMNGCHGNNERAPELRKETIYSSPAKSKVKQFIVPEDYYTTIGQVKAVEKTYANENGTREPNMGTSESVVRGNDSGDREFECKSTAGLSGYQFQYEGQRSDAGQISPDAKYSNNYEDVYDSILPQEIGTAEVPCVLAPPVGSDIIPKSRLKSPKKQKKFNPVSDVFASNSASVYQYQTNTQGLGFNKQVTDSVENVHAENVGNIPQIKLNDHGSIGINREEIVDDDDVFVEDELKIYGSNMNQQKPIGQVLPQQTTKSTNQNYEEINDLELINGEYLNERGTSDSSNPENDSGYMKMTLGAAETYGIAIHFNGHAANQNAVNGHVIEESSNHNARQVPDGEDKAVEEDGGNYEETGV